MEMGFVEPPSPAGSSADNPDPAHPLALVLTKTYTLCRCSTPEEK